MGEIFEKLPGLLFDSIRDHAIITVLTGLFVAAGYIMLVTRFRENKGVLIALSLLAWLVLIYFVSAVADSLQAVHAASQAQFGVAYALFIGHPKLVLWHILFWFVVLTICAVALLLKLSEWRLRHLRDGWRDLPRFTIPFVIFFSIFLGFITAKVHSDLLSPPASEATPTIRP